MGDFFIGQMCIIIFNTANAYIDAYRILKNKSIAHGINFVSYLIFCVAMCFIFGFDLLKTVVFLFSAFFNRQLFFDIRLNLRRGLPWYYQSTANPPKAILDRIERFIFGNEESIGKVISVTYLWFYIVFANLFLWV